MKYYKQVQSNGTIIGKGSTHESVSLLEGQIEISKEEYNALVIVPFVPDETEMPPTVEQQITEIQQKQQELQSVLDELLGVQENE